MNVKSLLVLAAATLCGVATAYFLREVCADRAAPEQQPAVTPVEQSAAADDPLPRFKVLDVDRVGDVPVPKGCWAVALRANLETIPGLHPLVNPQVRICGMKRDRPQDAPKTVLMFQDVLVLAADTQTRRDESGRLMPCNVFTVALTPAEVRTLHLADVDCIVAQRFNFRY